MATKKTKPIEADVVELLDRHTLAETNLFHKEALLREAETRRVAIDGALQNIVLDRKLIEAELEKAKDWRNGFFMFSDTVTQSSCEMFGEALRMWGRMKPGDPIIITLNTPGGEIVSGFGLIDEINRLRSQGHHITIRVRGQAASMGFVILQAADRREMGPSSYLMVHRSSGWSAGEAYRIEDDVETMRMFETKIIEIAAGRSGKSQKYFKDLFAQRKDIWFNAENALKHNLVDAIV